METEKELKKSNWTLENKISFAGIVVAIVAAALAWAQIFEMKESVSNAEQQLETARDAHLTSESHLAVAREDLMESVRQFEESGPKHIVTSKIMAFNEKVFEIPPNLDQEDGLVFETIPEPAGPSVDLYACVEDEEEEEAFNLCSVTPHGGDLQEFPIETAPVDSFYDLGIVITVANDGRSRGTIHDLGWRIRPLSSTLIDENTFIDPTSPKVGPDYKCVDANQNVSECESTITVEDQTKVQFLVPLESLKSVECSDSEMSYIQFNIESYSGRIHAEERATLYDLTEWCK